MKKVVFSLLMICLTFSVQSQISVKFGVKGGLNVSKIVGSATSLGMVSPDSKELTSGHFGLMARVKVLGLLAVQPEVLYSMQGTTYEGKIGPLQFSHDLKTNYVQVPVMVKFYPLFGFNIQAGPQFGYLVSAKMDDEDIKDQLNKNAFAFNVGAGLDLPFGLGVDARYSIGLSDVFKEGAIGTNRANVFTVAASYCF